MMMTVQALMNDSAPKSLYGEIEDVLTYTQTAAVLEILHALFRFVRSPVVPTTLQVGSRIVILWGFTRVSVLAQGDFSLFLMIASWSAVEIVRYNFYFVQLVFGKKKMPYVLFWMRYSAFMLLYPSGISGEILQILSARKSDIPETSFHFRFSTLLLVMYVPLSPFMIMNMWGNRKRAFKKDKDSKRPPRPIRGVVWPDTKLGGKVKTTNTNRAIWEKSVQSVDSKAAESVRKERNWRFGYVKHVIRQVELCAQSKDNALDIARNGLSAAHDEFRFALNDGEWVSLKEAMKKPKKNCFTHIEIQGNGKRREKLVVPYGGDDPSKPYFTYKDVDRNLEGADLVKQLDRWTQHGSIEKDAADKVAYLARNPGMMDLTGKFFVLLGATSAMGPLEILLAHGATIVAVDLDRSFVWKKLIAKARASAGRILVPVKRERLHGNKDLKSLSDDDLAEISGCNLLTDTPEIGDWIKNVRLCVCVCIFLQLIPFQHSPHSKQYKTKIQVREQYKKPITVGNYTYLDGGLHVQLAIACDAIIETAIGNDKDCGVAFLCTPTDCHPITEDAYDAAKSARAKQPFWQSLIHTLSQGKLLKSNILPIVKGSGKPIHLVNGIVSAQGPNYALAKRIQHWRAMIACSRGQIVCSNVAPSTATKSVVHASTFAAAYGGMHNFPPMEVMYQETSNAMMGALLIYDTQTRGKDYTKDVEINPILLFKHGSFHGGVWRAASTIGSMGETCFILYYLQQYTGLILLSLTGTVHCGLWLAGIRLY